MIMENTFSNSIILKLLVSLPQMWQQVEILAESTNMLLLSLHLNLRSGNSSTLLQFMPSAFPFQPQGSFTI